MTEAILLAGVVSLCSDSGALAYTDYPTLR